MKPRRLAVPALIGLAFIAIGIPMYYAWDATIFLTLGTLLVALSAILALIYGLVRFIVWSANTGRETQ